MLRAAVNTNITIRDIFEGFIVACGLTGVVVAFVIIAMNEINKP